MFDKMLEKSLDLEWLDLTTVAEKRFEVDSVEVHYSNGSVKLVPATMIFPTILEWADYENYDVTHDGRIGHVIRSSLWKRAKSRVMRIWRSCPDWLTGLVTCSPQSRKWKKF